MNTLILGNFGQFLKEQYTEAYGGSLGDAVKEALNPEKVMFLGVPVNPSYFTALGITAVLLIAMVLIRVIAIPKFTYHPNGFQVILEKMVSYFEESAEKTGSKCAGMVGPYLCTTGAFIVLGTLAELLGIRPAFADINTCFAMGLASFVWIFVCGFKARGVKRLKHFANPINIVTDLAVPLSLSLRLFGSIMSGFIIMELVYTFVYTSFVLPVVVSVVTTLFHAVIQAFLFTTLTTIFIGEAVE